ncbi:MAG: hypothetical protein WDM86_05855 [Rhizomicrobium sp.]
MPRVAAAFFATGVLCILVGGGLGIYIADGGNGAYAQIHVHLNLVGWATMGLCGTFYALTRETMSVRFAWINYAILTAGIVVFFPALALFLANGNDPVYVPVMKAGNALTGLGMALFAVAVFRELFRRRG